MKFEKKYKSVKELVKVAREKGWTHTGGRGLICSKCKSKDKKGTVQKAGTVRKFHKDGKVMYVCLNCNSYKLFTYQRKEVN